MGGYPLSYQIYQFSMFDFCLECRECFYMNDEAFGQKPIGRKQTTRKRLCRRLLQNMGMDVVESKRLIVIMCRHA